MNKHRKHYKPEQEELKMCSAIISGRECTFGDNCRFSHDISKYMASRPADLGEECPIYTLRGHCRFGVCCRFGQSHLDPATGANLQKEVAEPPYEEINVGYYDLIGQLRKNKVDFKVVDALAAKHAEDVQRQHSIQEGKLPQTSEAAASDPPASSAGDVDAAASGDQSAVELEAYHKRAREDALPALHERKLIDFRGKLYLAPLTTVGNLPYRRVCKKYGVDITCGEMALATSLLQGTQTEWALLKRHPCEDLFGVQLAGNQPQAMGRVAQLIERHVSVDFVDINMGCPIDSICNKGMGSALALRPGRIQSVVRTMSSVLSCPLTVKMRIGYDDHTQLAHKLIPKIASWGAAAVTLHGRTRQQRYSRSANWDYIKQCATVASVAPRSSAHVCFEGGVGGVDGVGTESVAGTGVGGLGLPLIGNGDVFSHEDVYSDAKTDGVSAVMIARGALVKPWIFTEIKERRHWDISASERLDILRDFTRFGLEHWGSDDLGVARVRKFLLEWLSFLHRYVPVGLLERLPARLQDRPPAYVGRNDLETLFASPSATDWVKITEMLLGPVPNDYAFTPKHKANAYDSGPIVAEG